MKPVVVVVEDEAPIRMGLCDVLAFHGYEPREAVDGPSGLALALSADPALVLLDVMMPGMDGFTVCERLRAARPGLGILVLTAKGSEADILRGFEVGADDYVTKPFSVAQLVARVQALSRRAGAAARPFVVGGVQVDPGRLQASAEGMVELSAREVDLLVYLVKQRGRATRRETLLKDVWGYARVERVETRCVDMAVVKLRRKLAGIGATEVIQTVRGVGYRCEP